MSPGRYPPQICRQAACVGARSLATHPTHLLHGYSRHGGPWHGLSTCSCRLPPAACPLPRRRRLLPCPDPSPFPACAAGWQGRQPLRDGAPGPERAPRLHHHHQSLPGEVDPGRLCPASAPSLGRAGIPRVPPGAPGTRAARVPAGALRVGCACRVPGALRPGMCSPAHALGRRLGHALGQRHEALHARTCQSHFGSLRLTAASWACRAMPSHAPSACLPPRHGWPCLACPPACTHAPSMPPPLPPATGLLRGWWQAAGGRLGGRAGGGEGGGGGARGALGCIQLLGVRGVLRVASMWTGAPLLARHGCKQGSGVSRMRQRAWGR